MVTFEGPGKVEEGGQAHGAYSHNYPSTKKKKTQKAILIPPSAEQQQCSASREFTAWELLQLSQGAFSAYTAYTGLCVWCVFH